MALTGKFEINVNEPALKPMDDKVSAAAAPPVKFHANIRGATGRPVPVDRRLSREPGSRL